MQHNLQIHTGVAGHGWGKAVPGVGRRLQDWSHPGGGTPMHQGHPGLPPGQAKVDTCHVVLWNNF